MKTLRNLLLLLVATLFITSCDEREFDMPPLNKPEFEYDGPITNIKDLVTQFRGNTLVEITEPTMIRGRVVANDVSGNIYQQIQVQDATGGIAIRINQRGMYGDLRVGQEIFINCQGLYYGEYFGNPQLGVSFNNSVGLISWNDFKERYNLNGWPNPAAVVPEVVNINDLNESYIGKLVTVTNVAFARPGQPFALPGDNNSATTRNEILNSATNSSATLTARNSSASNFASLPMPSGVGSVTGVLSIYVITSGGTTTRTLQITFRDYNDCSQDRFTAGEGNGSQGFPWSIDFALSNQSNNIQGWIQGYIVGAVASGINDTNPITDNSGISFAPPFLPLSVVLAASPDERDWTKCVVVSLPLGSDIYNQVNLLNNADNLGRLLKVTGTLENQLGAAGLTVSTGASNEFEFVGTPIEPGSNLILNETFGSPVQSGTQWPSLADFTGNFVTTGAGATVVTYTAEGGAVSVRSNQPSSNYTGASGSGNAMMAAAGASMLVNNIATCGATNLTLLFGTNETNSTLSVAYRINGTTNWVQIPFNKTTTSWGLVSVTINLPAGTNTINLKFTAARTDYGSRVDDINISTNDILGAPIIDPDNGGGTGPGTGDGTQASPYNIAAAQANQTSAVAWIQGYIVGSVKNGVSSITSANDVWIGVTSGWDLNTNVLLADDPNETDYTKCVVVNLPAGRDLRTQVNLVDNPGNFQRQLSVTGTLRTYFGIPGLRDSQGNAADFILQ